GSLMWLSTQSASTSTSLRLMRSSLADASERKAVQKTEVRNREESQTRQRHVATRHRSTARRRVSSCPGADVVNIALSISRATSSRIAAASAHHRIIRQLKVIDIAVFVLVTHERDTSGER